MKQTKTIYITLWVMAASMLLAIACKKDKEETFTPDRLFVPGIIKATSGETRVKLEWAASLYAKDTVTYVVEVSKDSTFKGTIDYTIETKQDSIIITDANIQIKTKYFARIKAKGMNGSGDSGWEYSGSFAITGEQLFLIVNDTDIKDKTVLLRWRIIPGLTKIVLTPASGAPIEVTLDATDQEAGEKLISGLTPQTQYIAEIFQNTLSKGTTLFTTKEPSIFTVILTPADNLITAVNNAAEGDVIGLQAGTYSCLDGTGTYANLVIQGKTITLQSVSGKPSDTKINYKEITLKGTGAGVTLKGIEFDGGPANTLGAQALYFLNLVGLASDAEAATFTNIIADNCIIRNMGNCLFRGNRAANNAHKINSMKFTNCKLYDNLMLNSYTFFTMDKLEFARLEITNSTINNIGRAFISWSTNITITTPPVILIDHCTINNFGREARNNFFIDANANKVVITLQNNIIANTPYTGQTVGTALVRATNAQTSVWEYTNAFKLTDGEATPNNLVLPAILVQTANKTVDLGWTGTTTDFTLPAGSELRTASNTGGPIGDLRWAQ